MNIQKHATRSIKIDRRRVASTDALVDISIDGRIYSSTEATNILICDRILNIQRFPYYTWSSEGIFRSGYGLFKYYYLMRSDNEKEFMNPKVIETTFNNSIDFESDTTPVIFEELESRLNSIQHSFNKCKEVKEVNNCLTAFDQHIEGVL